MMWDEEEYYEEEREDPSLVDPIGLPTFHDLNLPDKVYRWMRLGRRGYNGPALELQFCGKKVHGKLPVWMEDEEFPYYELFESPMRSFGDGLDASWLNWGLKNGNSLR